MRRYVVAVVFGILLQGLGVPGGGLSTGDISKDDFNYQRPTQSPHVLERACTTKAGFCRVANMVPPGQACYCLTNAGARVDGHVIPYRFSDAPPFNVK
jgi:hypothetical protein